jgi:hypothetical protein
MTTSSIYESPDGGDTVYVREAGSTEKTLHSVSAKKQTLMEDLRESKLWGDIHRTAKTDPELSRLLDQVKIYWQLKHGNK